MSRSEWIKLKVVQINPISPDLSVEVPRREHSQLNKNISPKIINSSKLQKFRQLVTRLNSAAAKKSFYLNTQMAVAGFGFSTILMSSFNTSSLHYIPAVSQQGFPNFITNI